MTLKQRMAGYAQQPQAENTLFFMSLLESFCLPAVTEALLVPMTLVNTEKAFRYALIAAVGSVVGALVGYLLGAFIGRTILEQIAVSYGFENMFFAFKSWYGGYAVALLATVGFSPLPFSGITVFSGIMGAELPGFLMAALLARGARFWLIAWLLWRGGPRFKEWVERNLAALTMSIALGALLFFVLLKYLWQYATF